MALDRIIEQIAFGSAMPKFKACLGLAVADDALFLSQARFEGGRPVVDQLMRVPIPPSAGGKSTLTRAVGSLNTELLADVDRLAELLKAPLSQVKWDTRFVVVGLSPHQGLLRYFTMPAIDRKFWKTAVPAESKKYVPLQTADMASHFQVFPLPPGPDKRPKQGVLYGVTPKRNVESVVSLCRKLGLSLIGVELMPCCLQRLLDVAAGGRPPAAGALVHFDGGWARTLLSENGVPVFFREILLPDQGKTIDVRKLDVPGCVDFAKKQFDIRPPESIQISGLSPEQTGWTAAVSQDGGIPAVPFDLAKTLGLKSAEWGGYAAVGAALKRLAPVGSTMDLSSLHRISDEERRVATAVFFAAGALAAVLFLMGAVRFAVGASKSRDLARVRGVMTSVPEFNNLNAEQIKKLVQDTNDKVTSFSRMTGAKVSLTRIMEGLAGSVPDSVWLTSIDFSNDLSNNLAGTAKAQRLALQGHAVGATPQEESDLIDAFSKRLLSDPRLNEVFQCNTPATVVNPQLPQDSGGDSAQAQKDRENRTSFTMDCGGK